MTDNELATLAVWCLGFFIGMLTTVAGVWLGFRMGKDD